VCGDARLMPEIRAVAGRVYAEAKGCDAATAEEWVADLERNRGRFYADVYL